MSFHVSDDILKELEQNIRSLHGQIIVNFAHNFLKDPSKIPELKKKYLQPHSNTNLKDTIRTPRKYMTDEQEEENIIKQHLVHLQELSDNDSDSDNEDKHRCLHMVRVNRKIRQCKHTKTDESGEFCKYHEDELSHPFGIKKIDTNKFNTNKFNTNKLNTKKNIFLSDSEYSD